LVQKVIEANLEHQ
jgi:hypothetical protein